MKTIAITAIRTRKRHHNFFDAAEGCGAKTLEVGRPEALPLLREADGLILPGGSDINPALYGEEKAGCRELDPEQDILDTAAVKAAMAAGIPIFGICRGMQFLNIYFGGSLIQDIPHRERHGDQEVPTHDLIHPTRVLKTGFLYRIFGQDRLTVNSSHHQAVARLGRELEAVQFSEDGLVEALSHRSLPVFGVQWHPERMCLANRRADAVDALPLFQYFISLL